MIDQQQAKFEGFALVEIVGHQRVAGFVTTEYFGNVAVFQSWILLYSCGLAEMRLEQRRAVDLRGFTMSIDPPLVIGSETRRLHYR